MKTALIRSLGSSILLAASLLGLITVPSALAVTQSGTSTSQVSANSTMASYTVPAGTNRLLVVVASDIEATDVSNVTFNGTAMTLVRKLTDTFAVDSIWVAAMGTSAGTTVGPIVMTSNGSNGARLRFIAASTFTGVDQARPTSGEFCVNMQTNSPGFNGGSTLTIGSLTGDLAFDIFDGYKAASVPTVTAGSSQTVIASQTAGTESYKVSTKPGPSSTMGWTSTSEAFIHVGMNIRAVPAATTNTVVTKSYTGADQTFTVPPGVTSINVKLWGAGGGTGGGSGAFVSGNLAVTAGETLTIVTGQGGGVSPLSGATGSVYGGGGLGYGNGGTGGNIIGGAGGGRSAVRRGGTDIVTAGAGGGGDINTSVSISNGTTVGGAGGLTAGGNAVHLGSGTANGSGGTQSAGGAKGGTSLSSTNGAQFIGGNGHSAGTAVGGGGGGSGYFGGGGGGDNTNMGSGGGGSSLTSGLTSFVGEAGFLGSRVGEVPGGTAYPEYVAGVARGGAVNVAGGNGLVVISYAAPASTTITSLNIANATPSNGAFVNWTLTFASPVTGLSASNFTLTGAAAAGSSVVSPGTSNSGLTWNVPVATGSTDGPLTLNLANATGLSQAISTTLPFTGQSYTMDKTAPTILSINRLTPAGQTTGSTSVTFRVTYSENVTGMTNSSFAVVAVNGSNIVGTVTGLSNITPTSCDVTVNITSGTGEFRLRGVN